MSKIKNAPFTNNFGDLINPGDTVIAVASGRGHTINIRKCKYLGLNTSGNPRIEYVEDNCFEWYDPATGMAGYWFDGCESRFVSKTKRSSLQLGRIFKVA